MNSILQKLRTLYEARPTLFSLLLITIVVGLFYANSFTADWHYDDFHHIKENINIRKLSNIPVFFTDPTTFSRNPQTRMYRPLLMATHAINYQIGIWTTRDGYNVVPYHVTNFLFHLIATIFIFLILRFLFSSRIRIEGLDSNTPALFGALLFGLQTINTETIVYVSSRSSVMATMFVLLAMYLYLKNTDRDRFSPVLFVSSLAFYMCGMLSKEIAITLPALLVYYEFFLNRDPAGETIPAFVKRIALPMLSYGATAVAFLLVREAIIKDNLLQVVTAKGGTPAAPDLTAQLATQSRAWVFYIREWLLPTGLSIDKPFAVSRNFGELKVLLSVALILAVLGTVLSLRRKHPAITFGVLWWMTALLPTTVIRLNVPINDHRLYLPGFGAVLIFAYIAGRLYVRFRTDSGLYYKGFVTVCVTVLLLMGMGTVKRNMAFATEETMWKDVILKDRNSVRGYNNLGIYYEQHGDFDRALQHYQRTIKLAPMFPNPYINVGNVYHKQKKYDSAEKYMNRAIQLDPQSALANYNLGNILREAGKTAEAINAYKRALQLNPRYIEAANNLANIYFKSRQYTQAIEYYGNALAIDPTFAMSYYNIGLAHENLGQRKEAIEAYERFLRYWLGDQKYTTLATQKIRMLQGAPGR